MDEIEFYLKDLESRFKYLDKKKYYLSYSGGKDSHFLYWFIKEYLHDNEIEIVGVNTYMEHQEILARIKKNCDIVLLPKMKPFEIKEKYGSPCFSKWQDDMIHRYQNGSRRPYLIEVITGINKDTGKVVTGRFKLNKTAKKIVLNDTLHKVSPKCCEYLKKRPIKDYEKESGRKAILGVRGTESALRSTQYKSCFTKDKKFTPLHDLSDELLNAIYKKYKIELPKIYNYINRTGCMGCPYGSHRGNTQKELALLNDNQREFVIKLFKESYDVLGINYKNKQLKLDIKFEENRFFPVQCANLES